MALNSLHLEAFSTCAQIGNFTRAAEKLHITQSALSQRIRNLEEELGTTLFIRDKKKIRLTEFGEKLIQYCRSKDAKEEELVSEIKSPLTSGLSGMIRLGAFSTISRSFVLPALQELLTKNPACQLRMVVRELYELEPLIKSGEIDFLLTTQQLNHQGLSCTRIGTETNVLIQRKGYKGPEIFLDHDEEDSTTSDYFGKRSVRYQRRYLDDIYGIIDGVRLGLGRAVVPLHLIGDYQDIEILHPSKTLKVPVILYYFEQPFYSRLHEATFQALSTYKLEDLAV